MCMCIAVVSLLKQWFLERNEAWAMQQEQGMPVPLQLCDCPSARTVPSGFPWAATGLALVFMSMTVSLGWTSHLAEWQQPATTLDTNLASHFYSILFRKCFFLSLFWDHVHVLSLVQISCGSFSAPVSETSARLKTGDIFLKLYLVNRVKRGK